MLIKKPHEVLHPCEPFSKLPTVFTFTSPLSEQVPTVSGWAQATDSFLSTRGIRRLIVPNFGPASGVIAPRSRFEKILDRPNASVLLRNGAQSDGMKLMGKDEAGGLLLPGTEPFAVFHLGDGATYLLRCGIECLYSEEFIMSGSNHVQNRSVMSAFLNSNHSEQAFRRAIGAIYIPHRYAPDLKGKGYPSMLKKYLRAARGVFIEKRGRVRVEGIIWRALFRRNANPDKIHTVFTNKVLGFRFVVCANK